MLALRKSSYGITETRLGARNGLVFMIFVLSELVLFFEARLVRKLFLRARSRGRFDVGMVTVICSPNSLLSLRLFSLLAPPLNPELGVLPVLLELDEGGPPVPRELVLPRSTLVELEVLARGWVFAFSDVGVVLMVLEACDLFLPFSLLAKVCVLVLAIVLIAIAVVKSESLKTIGIMVITPRKQSALGTKTYNITQV